MTKQYDIVDIIDSNSFTYQLYADMNVPVEGSSTVSSKVTTDNTEEVLFASFTVSGAAIPADPLVQQFGIEFKLGMTSLCSFFVESYSPSQQPPSLSYGIFSSTGQTVEEDQNGNFEIYRASAVYKLYKDEVLKASITASSQDFATSFSLLPDSVGSGLISNVILGTDNG